MATLKIRYLCAVSLNSDIKVERTQEIGDIPNDAISGIATRINQLNTALQQVSFSTIINQETQLKQHAVAIKYGFAEVDGTNGPDNATTLPVQKIIGAEFIVQETVNIYDYAQVGA